MEWVRQSIVHIGPQNVWKMLPKNSRSHANKRHWIMCITCPNTSRKSEEKAKKLRKWNIDLNTWNTHWRRQVGKNDQNLIKLIHLNYQRGWPWMVEKGKLAKNAINDEMFICWTLPAIIQQGKGGPKFPRARINH